MSFSNMDAYVRWYMEREQDVIYILYSKSEEHLDAPEKTEYVEAEHTGPDVTQSPHGSHHPTDTSTGTEEP